MQTNSISFYNPNNLTQKELINSFVIRKKEFQKIINDIKSSDMKYPEQHYMIEAQRGYGKTTLLKRLYFEIKRDPELKEKLIPVILPEEKYSIRRLFKLWEVVAQNLEKESYEFEGLYDHMATYAKKDDYEDISFKIIEQRLKEKNKKLILLIDNAEIILKKFKLIEQQKLREILLTSAEIRFIGASSEVLEFTFDYEKPFYDFFKLIALKGLTTEETNDFLEKLGEGFNNKNIKEIIKDNKGKIEAYRRLTGGVPRIMSLIFNSEDNDRGLALKDIYTLADRVTPLYKHIMDNSSPVQQEIVDIIALSWEAITTREIADKVRMQSKEVSAQLNQLEKNGVINKIPINKKNYMYQIKDRFFNIWYLIRFGGEKEKQQVLWLIKFLENWCNRDTLVNKSENNDFSTIYESSKALLLNDKIQESIQKAHLFLQVTNDTDQYDKFINEYFILLMTKKQYNTLLNLFNEKELMLKDKFKPTYYALMYFIKSQNEKYDIEYKKVGEELKETVKEIIEEVKKGS
ncbi:hypothetical protein [Clostridium sp.]|uniref:hypothetical protein n=1 Tax=Clostridium sp. TaxID=1506 RepID=UPI0026147055|nr:hypothetical protein [uncultured Clostridium sp.]